MRLKSKVMALLMVMVMLFTFVGMTMSASALTPNSAPYPHTQVTKTVVQYYEESKLGLHGWQCESTSYTYGNIDWIIYADGGGYGSTTTVTKTPITEGWLHRWYTKTTVYTYYDFHRNPLPIH